MRLQRYLERLFDTIHSRQEILVEHFHIEEVLPDRLADVEGRLPFSDGSLLEFSETVIMRGLVLVKTDYAYHYQRADGRLVFRYDNAPHHRELPGFPEHKHEEGRIVSAGAPDLNHVFREIDSFLYRPG
ncbi:MAG: DUF6516 family protein [Chloroflexi bacterium]|nr:DUF6516 family protein [Chloroflexota bacterium]